MNRIFIILVLCLPLWSCATYYATRDDVVSQLRSWEQEKEYGKIFNTLDQLKPKHEQYRQLQRMKPRLLEDARKYERSVSTNALKQAQKQDWPKALMIFDEGLEKYPQSTFIKNEKEKFLADREQYLHYLERKYLYERAEWLIRAIPQQQKIVDTNPKDSAQEKRLKKLQSLSEETADLLAEYGKEALKADRRMIASRSLTLANTLQPDDEYSQLLKQIKATGKQKPKKKYSSDSKSSASQQADTRQQALQQLRTRFELAYKNQDWAEAIDRMEAIEAIDPTSNTTKKARKRLDKQVDAYVKQQIKLGEHQYSQGDFTVALETWEAAHPLAPDNKALNKYIQRAHRVLESLKELSGRPPAIRFPVEDESPAISD